MPDPTEAPTISEADFSEAAIEARWSQGFEGDRHNPEPEVTPEPEGKKDAPKKDDAMVVPDQVLGIETPKEPEEDILNETPKGPIKHEHFKKVQEKAKADIAAAKAENERILKEYEEAKGKLNPDYVPEKVKQEWDGTKKRVAELEEELGRVAVEKTEAFKERFTNKQIRIEKDLKKAGEELEIKGDVITGLMHATGKRRFDLIEELDITSTAKSYLTGLLKDYDLVESEKSDFMADWKGQLSKHEETQKAQADERKAKLKEHEDRTYSKILEENRNKYGFLQKVDGNDKWNAQVDAIEAEAKKIFDGEGWDAETVAQLAIAGAGAKPVYAMLDHVTGRLREALTELASLKAASPTAPPPGGKPTEIDDSKLTFEQRAKRTFDAMVGNAANNGFNR